MTKCREIADISLVTDTMLIRRKTLKLKRRYDRYDTDNIDIGDISRHLRYIDPPLICVKANRLFYRLNVSCDYCDMVIRKHKAFSLQFYTLCCAVKGRTQRSTRRLLTPDKVIFALLVIIVIIIVINRFL